MTGPTDCHVAAILAMTEEADYRVSTMADAGTGHYGTDETELQIAELLAIAEERAADERPYLRDRIERAEQAAREQRWMAPARSRVSHPKYGSVIVPHASNLAATMNAAEFWRCDWAELLKDAQVELIPQNLGPLRRPREFSKNEKGKSRTDRPAG